MTEKYLIREYKKEITFYTDELLLIEYDRVARMRLSHLRDECLKLIEKEMKKRSE